MVSLCTEGCTQSIENPSPVATLTILSFAKLLARDHVELAKLLSSCEDSGFFYLDLRDWEAGELIRKFDTTNSIMKGWFEQSDEEKLKTETLSDAHGYKPTGVQSGVLENSRDGFEVLKISRTAMVAGRPLPQIVLQNLELFKGFQFSAHYTLKSLLACLSDAAGINSGPERFEKYHKDEEQSKSTLFFLHHPVSKRLEDETSLGHNMHTDVGSFTLLMTEQWGLQVLSPKTNAWEYVVPKPGFAIVNVADTLRFISGRRFRSAMHRVLPPAGKMVEDRYSTAYFLRAGDDTVFKGVDGKEVTANEWFQRKYHSFNQSLQEQREHAIATGGMDRDIGVKI